MLERVCEFGHAIGFKAGGRLERTHGHHSTNSPSHGLNQIQRKHRSQLEGLLLTLVAADSVRNQSLWVKVLLASRGRSPTRA
jgi:hypothetical protein